VEEKLGILLQCGLVKLLFSYGFAALSFKCGMPKQCLYEQRLHINYINFLTNQSLYIRNIFIARSNDQTFCVQSTNNNNSCYVHLAQNQSKDL